MKIVKIIGGVVVALIVLFVGIGFALPQHVKVERDITIDAPPEAVFAKINSFKHFNEWSPWAKRDPNTKYTYSGPETGVGAKMEWSGDPDKVGSGTQEIIESRPNEFVKNSLDFGEQGKGEAYFKLEPVDGKTKVTWGLDSDMGSNPIGRWFGLAMDGMIGADYEEGLGDLKKLVESDKG